MYTIFHKSNVELKMIESFCGRYSDVRFLVLLAYTVANATEIAFHIAEIAIR